VGRGPYDLPRPEPKTQWQFNTDDRAQVFWATAVSGLSEGNSLRFAVVGDGQFHDYELDMSESPQWRGLITSLRFDPSSKSGVKFAVDYIRFP
jgi:hypothetical protein